MCPLSILGQILTPGYQEICLVFKLLGSMISVKELQFLDDGSFIYIYQDQFCYFLRTVV